MGRLLEFSMSIVWNVSPGDLANRLRDSSGCNAALACLAVARIIRYVRNVYQAVTINTKTPAMPWTAAAFCP
jgi:hypothetical protein